MPAASGSQVNLGRALEFKLAQVSKSHEYSNDPALNVREEG